MRPHELFANALSAIQDVIYNDSIMMTRFSSVFLSTI